MAYSGKYILTNPSKYLGDPNKIVYRSLWEKATFKFMERCTNIKKWSSEVPILYICATDNKQHKYYVDLYIEFDDGKRIMVEIKPWKQTVEPKIPKKKTARYINEQLAYIKNMSKWYYAREFCKERDMEFQVWTEHYLKNELGLKII